MVCVVCVGIGKSWLVAGCVWCVPSDIPFVEVVGSTNCCPASPLNTYIHTYTHTHTQPHTCNTNATPNNIVILMALFNGIIGASVGVTPSGSQTVLYLLSSLSSLLFFFAWAACGSSKPQLSRSKETSMVSDFEFRLSCHVCPRGMSTWMSTW